MDRQTFINELRKSMSGHFSPGEIQETVDYYEDYIDMQKRKGRTEEEIFSELGDPRLLSKSMRAAGMGSAAAQMDRNFERREENSQYENTVHTRMFHVPCIVWILILALVVLIIGAVVGFVIQVILYILPVLLVAGAIYSLYRYFTKK